MKPIRLISAGLLLLSLALSGCSPKPLSIGDGGMLVIIADEQDRVLLKPAVERKFGQLIDTPHSEPLFDIIWRDGETFALQTRDPLLLLTAPLDGQGPTADLLRRMLTPDVEAGIKSGRFCVFTRRDPWAIHQLLLVLAGRNKRELAERVDEWIDSLFYWAMDFENKRLKRELLRRHKNNRYNKEFIDGAGFQINLQTDYIAAQNNDSLKFIRFIRQHPTRWIMVAWGENDEPITPEFVYKRRKLLGNSFLDPVVTYDDKWSWKETTLNEQPAILIRGIWATQKTTGGGPFFTYCCEAPDDNRYYLVDGAVFAPGQSKMPYLWQLDIMAQTFEYLLPENAEK